MEIVTTDTIPGKSITQVHGIAAAHADARVATAGVCDRPTDTNTKKQRDKALEDLSGAAAAMGANAVVGMRMQLASAGEFFHARLDLLVYGTAVTVEPDNEPDM